MPRRRSRQNQENLGVYMKSKRKDFQRLPAARRFVTLRASANNVMRKLEVHGLSVPAVLKALRATEKRMEKSLSKTRKRTTVVQINISLKQDF